MSAEELGRRLLAEVQGGGGGLDEVLRSVRLLDEPGPASRFGVAPLDRLLHLFEQQNAPVPPPAQRPERGSTPFGQTSRPVQNRGRNVKPPIIELTSVGPGAGKTHLLYLITAIAVLPRLYDGIDLQSKNSSVVVLDTDGRFLVERLVQVMRHHITACVERHNRTSLDGSQEHFLLDDNAVEGLITTSLIHVHILQPQSHDALLATLSSLPTYLFDRTAHHSTHRPLHSILLDSTSAFFWPVKGAEENSKIPRGPATSDSKIPSATAATASEAYTTLARSLLALQKTFSCAIVATTASLPPSKSSQSSPSVLTSSSTFIPTLRPLLPASWTSFPTLRLAVARDVVAPFAPTMSVQEARRERGERQGVVEKGRFGLWVDGWGADTWSGRVKEGLRGGVGAWGFTVGPEGVGVDRENRRGEAGL